MCCAFVIYTVIYTVIFVNYNVNYNVNCSVIYNGNYISIIHKFITEKLLLIHDRTGTAVYNDVQGILATCNLWKSVIHFKGIVQPNTLVASEHNLSDFMHDPGFMGYSFPAVLSNFMFDPSVYNGPEAYTDLSKAIQMACKNSGFKTSRGSTCRPKPRGKKLASLHFICEHGRKSVTALKQQNISLKYKTSRPMSEEEQCPFQLKVFCAKHDRCWYLQPTYENHSASCVHKGHVQLLPEKVRTPLNQPDENALKLALQMHEDNGSGAYGSEEEDRKNKKQTVKSTSSNDSGLIDHTSRFSSCESLLKDIWKQIEGKQDQKNELHMLLQQFHDVSVSKNATELCS